MQPIEGYSVLITGGGSGLGLGIAKYLAARGAMVTISGRRADKLRAAAAEIGSRCTFVAGNITDEADRERMIETAVKHGGGLQGLVNNAGNMLRGPITELAATDMLDLFDTNVVAGMRLTGLAAPHVAKDGGAVIFIGSGHTRRAFPGCLVPGAVPTELNVRAGVAASEEANLARLKSMEEDHPLGRIGTPEEIAEACDYLLRAEWTTGTSIVVDGGLGLGVSYK